MSVSDVGLSVIQNKLSQEFSFSSSTRQYHSKKPVKWETGLYFKITVVLLSKITFFKMFFFYLRGRTQAMTRYPFFTMDDESLILKVQKKKKKNILYNTKYVGEGMRPDCLNFG